MSRHAREVLATVLLLTLGCAEEQDLQNPYHGLRAELVGCYALFVAGRPLDSTYYGSSPQVGLDSLPLRGNLKSAAYRVLRRLDARGRQVDAPEKTFTSWAVDSLTGTVELSFHNGFSGAVLTLRPAGHRDTLEGRIANNWDFGPGVSDRAKARAVRVPCP